MNIESFIKFLAHSTVNDRFDEQLEAAGLKERPKGDDPTVFVKSPDEGFILGFSSNAAFQEFYATEPKTPGGYILVSIYGEPGKAELPFALDWAMTANQIKSRLGEPKRIAASNATFVHEGLQVVCRFKDKSMQEMTSATVSLIDIYAKQRFGL
ncbi:hypothetical protein [Roseateles amylovorans]|uniref:Uncharacterized protein n=1 Tax=Roseateles amylovorans TaxID=2978473 RepID=A0ABY6B9P4_9BURK|nr:hypothetical protein [Roseateles amylovorans]UXH80631.1 hypothetical protein N4261_12445 [Roseateles amylovorans]